MSNILSMIFNGDYSKTKFSVEIGINSVLKLVESIIESYSSDDAIFYRINSESIFLEPVENDDGKKFIRISCWDEETDTAEGKDE